MFSVELPPKVRERDNERADEQLDAHQAAGDRVPLSGYGTRRIRLHVHVSHVRARGVGSRIRTISGMI